MPGRAASIKRRVLPTMIGFGLALLAAQAAPSYVRSWTYLTGDYSNVLGVRSGTVYYQSAGWLGAVDVAKGTKIWEVSISYASVGALGDSEVYVVLGEKPGKIFAFSLTKGTKRQVATLKGEVPHIAWGGRKAVRIEWQGRSGSRPIRQTKMDARA